MKSITIAYAKQLLNKKEITLLDLQKLRDDKPELFNCLKTTEEEFSYFIDKLQDEKKLTDYEYVELYNLFDTHGEESFLRGEEQGVETFEKELNLDDIKSDMKNIIFLLTSERKSISTCIRKDLLNSAINVCRELSLFDEQSKGCLWLRQNKTSS